MCLFSGSVNDSKGQKTKAQDKDYYAWENESFVNGYAAMIKLDPSSSFNEENIKNAVENNLEVKLEIFSDEKTVTQTGIMDAVDKSKKNFKCIKYIIFLLIFSKK